MTPLDVLREYVIDLDTQYGQDAGGRDALAQVETLVEAARRAITGMTPLRSFPGVTGTIDDDAIAELRAALAPFVSGSEGETA